MANKVSKSASKTKSTLGKYTAKSGVTAQAKGATAPKKSVKKKATPPPPVAGVRTTYAPIKSPGTSTAAVTQAISDALGSDTTDVFGSDNTVYLTVQKQGGA
jgi:hypothetical protein